MALRMTENHTELSFRYMRIEGRKEKLLDFLLRKFRYLDREEWLENIRENLEIFLLALPGSITKTPWSISQKKSTAGKNSSPSIAWTGKPAESSFLQNKKRLPKKWQKCSENNKPVNFTKPYLKTACLQMMLLCPCR